MYKKGYTTSRGFTLIELLIIIAIIAIAATIAAPDISKWQSNSRLNAAARDVASFFKHARMEAAKRNVSCTITFNLAVGGVSYDYVVYVDTDQDLEYDTSPAPGEKILKSVRFSDYKSVNLSGVAFANNDNGRPSVAFNPRGLAINNAGGSGAGNINLGNDCGRTKTITVTGAGYVSIN